MREELKDQLKLVMDTLKKAEVYEHAVHVLNFDQETICPPGAMQEQGEVMAFLANKAFEIRKDPAFLEAAEALYAHREELEDPDDRILAEALHRAYLKTKNITPEQDLALTKVYNQAFVDWLQAKKTADFSVFAPSLEKVREANLKEVELAEYEPGKEPANGYDALLDKYERGMTSAVLDEAFGTFLERMEPLLRKIQKSPKKIRTDFLSREVTDEQQRRMAEYLLDLIGFDFHRGAFTTTEHPFTDELGRNDERVTTHYYPTAFASSMFSIIHEGGHALFDQNQPAADHEHFIYGEKTMGQHESVSRFYENRIGRSRAFIHLIYPKCREIFPQVFTDVSEEELYEALNVVSPSLIRTEADEFTYTFHIIVRYELEKEIVNGNGRGGQVDIGTLPQRWNDLYEKYLGIRPGDDREGILQDVHWSEGFGYFPTYALGNMYNAMYYNRMAQDIDIDAAVAEGNFALINGWMREHVFAKADRLSPMDWIRDITGRDFTPDDFLDYLQEKYTALYEL